MKLVSSPFKFVKKLKSVKKFLELFYTYIPYCIKVSAICKNVKKFLANLLHNFYNPYSCHMSQNYVVTSYYNIYKIYLQNLQHCYISVYQIIKMYIFCKKPVKNL